MPKMFKDNAQVGGGKHTSWQNAMMVESLQFFLKFSF